MLVSAAAAGNNLLKADFCNYPAITAVPVLAAAIRSASPAASAVYNLPDTAAAQDDPVNVA